MTSDPITVHRQPETLPAQMRAALRNAVPEVRDWKRDRGGCLFRGYLSSPEAPTEDNLSDTLSDRLTAAGFRGCMNGRFLTVEPLQAWPRAVCDAFPDPPDSFAASVSRDGDADIALFSLGIKLLESSTETERVAYRDRVHAVQAVALREKHGSTYAAAILLSALLKMG